MSSFIYYLFINQIHKINKYIMKSNDNIGISVVTSANLKERYSTCMNTWAKDFDNIFFFGGYLEDECLISIPGAGEDYNSHFIKQQLGFKYMFEQNPDLDWYGTTTCDAILFKERAIDMLSKYDRDRDFAIGQANCYWTDEPFIRQLELFNSPDYPHGQRYLELLKNPRIYRAFAGGAGIFLSNSLMKKCYGIIDEFNSMWIEKSGYCYPYSDVALPYMLKIYFGIDITFEPRMLSQTPSHYKAAISGEESIKRWYVDYPISLEEVLENPISFHYIKPAEMSVVYESYKVHKNLSA